MAIKGTNPNRQKMINLMYIVFIAMMALNVSSDVLDGFSKVNSSLSNTCESVTNHNGILYNYIKEQYKLNSVKTASSYSKSNEIQAKTKELSDYIEGLKIEIARNTDGKNADVNNIKRKDYIEATNTIMLSPVSGEAYKLKKRIDEYKKMSLNILGEPNESKLLDDIINTDLNSNRWAKDTFYNLPTVATITMLTKLQNDISIVENRVLSKLIDNIDYGDYKVNKLKADVVPNSNIVVMGQNYEADIILTSVDSTKKPVIYVGGEKLSEETNGHYTIKTNKAGTFDISGYMEIPSGDNKDYVKYPFSKKYTVVEPLAVVSPKMMNVVYAGIDNPIDISVPGFSTQQIIVTANNGNIQKKGNEWVINPKLTPDELILNISVKTDDGKSVSFGSKKLKVRQLPDPLPYIYAGGNKLKNGKISKKNILDSNGIKSSIDDGILNIDFEVQSFSIISFDSMGNTILEKSNGSGFSSRQISLIKNLQRNSRVYITNIIAKGPDGAVRNISPMELIII